MLSRRAQARTWLASALAHERDALSQQQGGTCKAGPSEVDMVSCWCAFP